MILSGAGLLREADPHAAALTGADPAAAPLPERAQEAIGAQSEVGTGVARRSRSLSAKLAWAVALAVVAALVINSGLGLSRETRRWASDKEEVLFGTAQMLAANLGKAVAANDVVAIRYALRVVGRIPGQVQVAVENNDRVEIASMGDAVRLGSDLVLTKTDSVSIFDLLNTRTVQVVVPIVEGGVTVGTVRVVSDTSDLFARFQGVIAAGLWSGLAALTFGLLVSLRLQRSITEPLRQLTAAVGRVARTHDYGASVEVASKDEIGVLAESFNGMLNEIRGREREIVTKLVRAAEYRDTDTGEHVSRVARYAEIIARGLGLPDDQCRLINLASTMHDMGKIGVPDSILLKKGPLTDSERAQVERHARIGRDILEGSTSSLINLACDIAYTHHERWDGAGYPERLRGEEIPLAGRIVAVADVFDALTTERPYKRAWPLDRARAHLEEHAGRHFDPACVEAFLKNWPDVEAIAVTAAPVGSLAAA